MAETSTGLMADLKSGQGPTPEPKRTNTLLIAGVFFAMLLLVVGAGATYYYRYEHKVYPGVQIGNLSVGGLTADQVKNVIETANNRYAKEGITLALTDAGNNHHDVTFSTVLSGDNPVEILELNSDAAARMAMAYGHSGAWWQRLWEPVAARFGVAGSFDAPLSVDTHLASGELSDVLGKYEDTPSNARIRFKTNLEPETVEEKTGYVYDTQAALRAITQSVAHLSFTPVRLSVYKFIPTIRYADVEKALPTATKMLQMGDITLGYTDATTKAEQDWTIKPERLAAWMEVRRDQDNTIIFALRKDAVQDYLKLNVQPVVDKPAAEAKFEMENGKVIEFQASRTGLVLNMDKTYEDLDAAFRARNYAPADVIRAIGISMDIAEPTLSNANVDTLGISEIVGVGVSSFRGSHPARIKNVARAVELLNGVLIRPGEIFSTTKYVGPITPENGYYPELVIKGNNASQKEVGGGMCQIGTTLFRMAMNSGMPITERRNHSLVVNYYADPVNGNPGTDATIYDPIVDFKFTNDTGNYLLLQTDMDMKTLQLTFTLWGKKDGRSGSYTHPTVTKWIPTGDPVNTVVTDGTLKPGEEQCQPAYKGAVASFVYTRITPQGEKIEEEFKSYYRPLPKMCRIGVEPGNPCLADNSCFPAPVVSSTVK